MLIRGKKGEGMLPEPTPRTIINDLYRLEKERMQAHERVIRAIRHDADTSPYELERSQIADSQQEIRAHLKNNQE